MTPHTLAKLITGCAVAAMTLTSALAAPTVATAQTYDNNPPPSDGAYYDPCRRDENNRAVAGGLLGGVAGAVIGNSIGHGGGKAGGTILGGLAGAAVGATVGKNTAACDPNGYAPPPPPPPADPYPHHYYDDRARYEAPPPPPPPECGAAEVRTYFPDGTVERHTQRACRDAYGRFQLTR